MEKFYNVNAIGKDKKNRHFKYVCCEIKKHYDLLDKDSIYLHYEIKVSKEEDFEANEYGYRATAVAIDSQKAISTEMFAENETYRELGLPEAILYELAKLSKRKIYSSSNKLAKHILRGEFRDEDAEKVWLRLVNSGKAIFDEDTNRYELLNNED
jgi:hypothetical protein